MKRNIKSILIIATLLAISLTNCTVLQKYPIQGVCDFNNDSYTWLGTSATPPVAMITKFNQILNNLGPITCNNDLEDICEQNDTQYSETVLGNSMAETNFIISDKTVPINTNITYSATDLNNILQSALAAAKQNAPWCSCQSYNGRIAKYDVKSFATGQGQDRKGLFVTVTYECCGACR